MNTQVLFNQLAYIDRLVRGGFSADQARASVEALESAFTESIVTKSDLEREIASVRSEISSVRSDISSVRSEIGASETRLQLEIARAKNETLRWFFAINLGLIGAIFTIVKFVH